MRTETFPRKGSYKEISISLATPYENTITPEALPTTEPGTPQVSYTVSSGDFPTIDDPKATYKVVCLLYAGGQNLTGSGNYMYWRMKKNDGDVANGSKLCSTNYYYTCNCCFYDVAVNDVLDIYLWGVSGFNFRYEAMSLVPTRVYLSDAGLGGNILNDGMYFEVTAAPTLTAVIGTSVINAQSYYYPFDETLYYLLITANIDLKFNYQHDTFGLGKYGWGDASTPDGCIVSSSNGILPYYRRGYILSKVMFNPKGKLE